VLVVLVEVNHGPSDIEEGDHFLAIIRHNKRMNLTKRLEDIGAGFGNPVMLSIEPLATDYISVDGVRMQVP
jgi:hypothetical protein